MPDTFMGPHQFGTRHDPHVQARLARETPLLLHSMRLFREIFAVIFEHRPVSNVVEIGVESGAVSSMYAELGAETVHCVEPEPTDELRRNLEGDERLRLVERPSPQVLPELPLAELYVLDGDHNYTTLRHELEWIFANAPGATVVMHDLLWPCSRRDQYYAPEKLETTERHPTTSSGPTIWHDEVTEAGFVGNGAFCCAQHAGGERNGLLTAVEDVLSGSQGSDWEFDLIPAVFGLGVLYRKDSQAFTAGLPAALEPYRDSRLLYAMENNRIALYTRVLQLQYEASAHADNTDRLAVSVSEQHDEIERLRAELADERESRNAESARLRSENEQLTRQLERLSVQGGGAAGLIRRIANRVLHRVKSRST
ncbi:Methyltransferase domain-containing protein [Actinopolyspora xinjiangensis]|uniref:Methyltransferase domain-containing protein n=1 Tax=Actinopolyspora xinjiangensis TaxID=405564 RepID=A0A1H0W890_9ACTN|nr:class I SAM-dependent methyltransferase [Actinopolyspora xinjiangensis]SDP86773.1 Methyltransferase domain-containing protein [Actinopolyspora xinjiangensis]